MIKILGGSTPSHTDVSASNKAKHTNTTTQELRRDEKEQETVHTLMFKPSSGCSSSLPVGHTESSRSLIASCAACSCSLSITSSKCEKSANDEFIYMLEL